MKKAFILLPIFAVVATLLLCSNRSGPALSGNDASMARGGTGCNNGSGCHGGRASSTTVSITLDSSGYTMNHYIAGNTYNIVIKGINTSSTTLPAFGFTLTAVKASGAGTTSATNAGTLASSGLPSGCVNRTLGSLNLIEHNGPIGPTSGSGGSGTVYSRTISWTAPATGSGPVILFGVLNAINNNSNSSGDSWNWSTDTLNEFFPSVLPITGPSSVCAGSSISLTSGTSGGTWSTSNSSIASVSTTGVVTGVSGGTAIISYNTGGSLGLDTATVVVSPLPYAGTLYGGTKICTNDSFTVYSTATGGVWSSTSPTIVSVHPTTGRIHSGSSTGIATIIYAVTNVCGSSYAYNPDTVVTAPATGTITGPSFCEGFSAQLYRSTGTGGGTWSTSSTSIASVSSTGMLYGISRGSAAVTYSVSSRCGNTICVNNFTILSSPPNITGPSFGCVGATITLSDSVTGGIWRGSNPSVAAVAAGFGTVTGIMPGVDTITYIAPSGCVTKTPITIYASPGSITGTFTACPGNTTVLSNPTPGGTWSSANPAIASVTTTGIVTGVSSNTTTITYALTGSRCNATAPFTVYPQPSFIQGPDAFCSNATDTVFDLTRGGAWTAGPASVASIDTGGVITGIGGGTALVTYTMPTGCFVSRSFTVRPAPNPTITIDYSRGSFLTESYFTSYQWYRDGILLSGATTPTVGAPYNGAYTVHVVDSFGCESTSAAYNFNQVGVPNINHGIDVTIFPNPASDFLNIECIELLGVRICAVDGHTVLKGSSGRSIDIRSLATGTYIVQLFDANGANVATSKFRKQ